VHFFAFSRFGALGPKLFDLYNGRAEKPNAVPGFDVERLEYWSSNEGMRDVFSSAIFAVLDYG
jgi:hypothetical protein